MRVLVTNVAVKKQYFTLCVPEALVTQHTMHMRPIVVCGHRLRLLWGAGGYPPNVLQPTDA
jgi:hypothetical protein